MIEYYANHCIDHFIERGEVDIVHDFADPLPVMVTLHKLGLPIDDWRRYAEPMHKTVFLRQDNPARAGVLEELAWIVGTIKEAIQQRKESPRDDMITYLLSTRPFGEPVSDHAVQEMVMLTMQGGFDTTGSAISSALIYLDRDRDARRRLIDEPDLMRTAVEEFLRVRGPAVRARPHRQARRRGRRLPDRARASGCCSSGRRATATRTCSTAPTRCVLDRFPNRHMAFGLGAHRCLGSTLARRQIHVALRAILRRMPDYEVDHDRLVRAETIGVTYGTFAMPITFTPGPRPAAEHRPDVTRAVHRRPRPLLGPLAAGHALAVPRARLRASSPEGHATARRTALRPGRAARRGGRRAARQGRPHPVRDAPTPRPDAGDRRGSTSLADAQGCPDAIVAGCRIREPDAGAVIARQRRVTPLPRCPRPLDHGRRRPRPRCAVAFDAAAEHGASVELMLPLEHYDSIAALAERVAGVTIVLGHAGQPLERDADYLARWSAALAELAERGAERRAQAVGDRLERRSGVDDRQHPPLGAGGDRGVRLRSLHVRQQLADRPPVRHVPPADRRLPRDRRRARPSRPRRRAARHRRPRLPHLTRD